MARQRKNFAADEVKNLNEEEKKKFPHLFGGKQEPAPAPVGEEPAPAPVPAPNEPAPAPAPNDPLFGVQPEDPPQPSGPSERELELERELAEAKENLRIRTEADTAVQQELAELRALREQRELDQLTNLDGVEFDTVDPDTARELTQKVMRPLLARQQKEFNDRQAELARQIESDRAQQRQRVEQETQAQQAARLRKMNEGIYAQHKDFDTIRNSKAFKEYMDTPARPDSSITIGQMIAHEYHAGTDKSISFINQAISQFKENKPSLEHVASTTTSTVATQPAVETDDPLYSYDDLENWRHQVRTGRMTRVEFAEKQAAFKQAEQNGRVR